MQFLSAIRFSIRAMVALAIALLVLVALVRLIEPTLAFFPNRGETETPADSGVAYRPIDVATADGHTLHGWWMPHPSARATILYLHGNGGNLSLWAPILVETWRRGYAVFAIDYRGYGLSTGRPSEAGLRRDVEAALGKLDDLPDRVPAPLVYWGRSLGSVMAAYAASRRPPDGLVLESGFPTMRSVLEGSPLWLLSWFSSYSFPADRWLGDVAAPTLVLHGDRDSVIPFRLGERLYQAVRGPKTFVRIPGGDHNDAVPADARLYWDAVGEFVEGLARR
jgi:fermentation-respiration switch protein FrsA (DUF1100 family)